MYWLGWVYCGNNPTPNSVMAQSSKILLLTCRKTEWVFLIDSGDSGTQEPSFVVILSLVCDFQGCCACLHPAVGEKERRTGLKGQCISLPTFHGLMWCRHTYFQRVWEMWSGPESRENRQLVSDAWPFEAFKFAIHGLTASGIGDKETWVQISVLSAPVTQGLNLFWLLLCTPCLTHDGCPTSLFDYMNKFPSALGNDNSYHLLNAYYVINSASSLGDVSGKMC